MSEFPLDGPPRARGSAPRLAWLFDVDGTLLLTDGASREAFASAVAQHLGVEDDLRDIAFAGSTEPRILGDILYKHGRRFAGGEEPRFWATVFERMRALLHPERGRLLPGVPELLDAIEAESGWVKGLLTGNMTGMAAIKLRRFHLAERFAFGTFGQEAENRDALARLAVERVRSAYGIPPSRCIVVGDTEHDIRCARFAGARVVAVATGTRRREELAAYQPDLLLDDLAELNDLLAWARRIAAGE